MNRKQTLKMPRQQQGCFAWRPKHNPFLIALLPGNFGSLNVVDDLKRKNKNFFIFQSKHHENQKFKTKRIIPAPANCLDRV
ncbi:hypothetical protein [Mariniphaga sp.]|uniref:hypothetical protein n=1 Tax=Mariniphaga sp. TaxID=1954475 RepID=UPI0035686F5C